MLPPGVSCQVVMVVTSRSSVARPVTVNDMLDGRAVLDTECPDRIHLSGYVPLLQVGGQVVRFMKDHLATRCPRPQCWRRWVTGSGLRWLPSSKTTASRWSGSLEPTGRSM